jgi:hypothetical protein
MTEYKGQSEFEIKKVLDNDVNGAYVALYSGNPYGAGTEITGIGYARKQITCSPATFSAPTGTITNSAIVDFGSAGSVWGTIDHMAIYDAPTGGHMIHAGPLTLPRDIQDKDPVTFPIGTLIVSISQTAVS